MHWHPNRASGAAHKKRAYNAPTPNWRVEIVMGYPKAPPAAFNAVLFEML